MKGNFRIIIIVLFAAVLLTGCGKSPVAVHESAGMADEFRDAPSWVASGGSEYEGGIAVIGSAKIGKAGMQMARTEALAMGRNELAREINVKVNNLVKNFTQQIGVGDDQAVDKVAVDVSKQVASQSLYGSGQRDAWISPSNTLYVLVTARPERIRQSIQESVRTSMKNEEALWQKFQAEKGFGALDREIEKEFGDYLEQ